MAELPQGRRPTQRTTRPLLIAGAGVALVKMASGCLIAGNLVAPPCDDTNTDDPFCQDYQPDAGTSDGGTTTDGGTADGGR